MKAILTIGISASGKTTYAGMQEGYETISRDDIRFGIICPKSKGWKDYKFTRQNEAKVTEYQKNFIQDAALWKQDIIIADTNINTKTRKDLVRDLQQLGYEVEYLVIHVSPENAIERDSYRRNRVVGEAIITQQFENLNKILPNLKEEARKSGVKFSEIYN